MRTSLSKKLIMVELLIMGALVAPIKAEGLAETWYQVFMGLRSNMNLTTQQMIDAIKSFLSNRELTSKITYEQYQELVTRRAQLEGQLAQQTRTNLGPGSGGSILFPPTGLGRGIINNIANALTQQATSPRGGRIDPLQNLRRR